MALRQTSVSRYWLAFLALNDKYEPDAELDAPFIDYEHFFVPSWPLYLSWVMVADVKVKNMEIKLKGDLYLDEDECDDMDEIPRYKPFEIVAEDDEEPEKEIVAPEDWPAGTKIILKGNDELPRLPFSFDPHFWVFRLKKTVKKGEEEVEGDFMTRVIGTRKFNIRAETKSEKTNVSALLTHYQKGKYTIQSSMFGCCSNFNPIYNRDLHYLCQG